MPATGLRTERLLLTPLSIDDVGLLVAHWNVPQTGRFLWDGRPVAESLAQEVVARSELDFEKRGYGLFVLHSRASGELLGTTGLRYVFELDEAELVYSLDPAWWSRGFATEAAEAVVSFAFQHCGLTRVIGGVDPANDASTRVLERLGFAPWQRFGGREYFAVERVPLALPGSTNER